MKPRNLNPNDFDIIIIGAGHAGIEAAISAAKMGSKTLIVSFSQDNIGQLSCNPAIGGVGKGQLVKEIDALGGQMGILADKCAIGYRMLNTSKGPAVQSSRAQIDRDLYLRYSKELVGAFKNVFIKQAEAKEIVVNRGKACGIRTKDNEEIYSKAVIISAGTFLGGLIHIGLKSQPAGRLNEQPAVLLNKNLKKLRFKTMRFKTGTCARLHSESIDFSNMKAQQPDLFPVPFSSKPTLRQNQVPCFVTYTNEKTHKIIRDNLGSSPLYTGKIKARGVRYCPSIEDKVVKFAHHERHQVFLEPETLEAKEYYPNGLSTSLPVEVQEKFFRTIPGLENARFIRPGYGIEHEVIDPTQLLPTLESKHIKGLFFAGQINGTTGYEEAAAQGLIAGINAALRIKNEREFILSRAESYIGVLIDDLVLKGTNEPYRMFTSRVEYRLLLREDNAYLRLRQKGFSLGLINGQDYLAFKKSEAEFKSLLKQIKSLKVNPSRKINLALKSFNTTPILNTVGLAELLRRPELDQEALLAFGLVESQDKQVLKTVVSEIKYEPFIKRFEKEIEDMKDLSRYKLAGIDYKKVPGLSLEVAEKLGLIKPLDLAQALRISGVTPASISVLMVWLKKREKPLNPKP